LDYVTVDKLHTVTMPYEFSSKERKTMEEKTWRNVGFKPRVEDTMRQIVDSQTAKL